MTPVPLIHSTPTFGYVLDWAGKRCAYLTDTVGLPDDTTAFTQAAPLDLLVLDCSHAPGAHAPRNHNDLTRALEIVRRLPVRKVVLTHIGHEFDAWLMANEGALPEGVSVGADGLVLGA